MKGKNLLKSIFFVFGIGILISSCDKSVEITGDEYVNNWIFTEMNEYYLWNNQIPSKPDKSLHPDKFFKSLLSNEDRFS